jgi:hypothetical protein
VWVGLKNGDHESLRLDLLAKVYLNGSPVGSGQLDSVAPGAKGFSNARLSTIPLTLAAPVTVSSGEILSIEILVRNACLGSGKNSGVARLWYNGRPIDTGPMRDAGSRFDATIGGSSSDYFLRGDFLLMTTAGSSRLSVDTQAGKRCSAFHSFGTWGTPLP